MRIQEGTCMDVSIQIDGRIAPDEEWLDVSCFTHGWECGHKHTRWGPVLRCVARHVASRVDDEGDEVDDPVGSESEQVTSEGPSAGS